MPGIAGVLGTPRAQYAEALVRRMTAAITHAPSHVSTVCSEPCLQACVGWVGHRGSFSDCMPAWNETRDICLLFSGEEFGDGAPGRACQARGRPSGPCIASDLVHRYEAEGPAFFKGLNGWFAGVILDLRAREAVLFNDRYGIQRVYCHQDPSAFYFCSEAKGLLRILPHLRRVDHSALAETFSFGCVLGNRSLFPGVTLLPGASAWTFRGAQPRAKQYFSPEDWEAQPALDAHAYCERMQDAVIRVLPRYLRDAERHAMSLTGGLDGRLIMAAARPPAGSLPCYTFASEYRPSADVTIARAVAQACGQTHQTIVVDGRFRDRFPALAERTVYVSDGAMDVSGAVELYVNEVARDIAPVRLTGNYGSEILRRHVAFRPRPFQDELVHPDFGALMREAALRYDAQRARHTLSFIAFSQVPWHHYARLAVEQSQLVVRSPYLDNDLVALAYRAPPELAGSPAPLLRTIAAANAALARIPTDRGLSSGPVTPLSAWRRIRSEVTSKAEYAYDYGMPGWLARLDARVGRLHPERLFLGRHKFYHFRVWYRDQLWDYVRDVLLDSRSRARPYLDAAAVERMVAAHRAGRANFASEIHRLLTAELLQRLLVEQP